MPCFFTLLQGHILRCVLGTYQSEVGKCNIDEEMKHREENETIQEEATHGNALNSIKKC